MDMPVDKIRLKDFISQVPSIRRTVRFSLSHEATKINTNNKTTIRFINQKTELAITCIPVINAFSSMLNLG
jgi:hypothetical protein